MIKKMRCPPAAARPARPPRSHPPADRAGTEGEEMTTESHHEAKAAADAALEYAPPCRQVLLASRVSRWPASFGQQPSG
jgi:hypothetical protein